MIDRREFLKQGGILAAAPAAKLSLFGDQAGGEERPVPRSRLEWGFSGGKILINLDSRRMGDSLCPGYLQSEEWRTGEKLTLEKERFPYSDRLGAGFAALVSCKLGSIDGKLLLINYADGKAGCRLDLTNNTPDPVVLGPYSPLMTHPSDGALRLTGEPAEWRVYTDSGACGGKCASYGINENEGENRAGAVSVLWSPGGNESVAIGQVEVERSWTSVAYLFGEKGSNTHVYRWAQARNLRLRLEQDATGYQLDPGETFHLDLCLLASSPDPFHALIAFRDAMVVFNQVRKFTNDDTCVGWMTCYNTDSILLGNGGQTGIRASRTGAAVTLDQSRFIVESGLRAYGIRDIEIDGCFTPNSGDWLEHTPLIPQGMDGLSQDLQKLGMRPDFWITPFLADENSRVYREHPNWFVKHAYDSYGATLPIKPNRPTEPLSTWWPGCAATLLKVYDFDPTAPGAIDWLLNVFRTFKSWGYWFFKNDFSNRLFSSQGKQYYNRKQTGLMRWRWTWRKIKEALGGDGASSVQLCGANNIGALGIVDSVRTGGDTEPYVSDVVWGHLRELSVPQAINRWWQHKHFFISDPDNLLVSQHDYLLYRDIVDFEYKKALSFDEGRIRAALVVATGGNIWLGDRLTLLEPERIAIIKKTLPLYGEGAIPLDMFEQTLPSLWWHHITKPWGSWEVISVVNFGEASLVKEVPLSKMGIPRDRAVIAWELWSGTEHPHLEDHILRVVVKPHSVKTLRITPIDRSRSALVGSSFHITMGAVEIREISDGDNGSVQVHFFRPAVENGHYAFWSARKQAVISMPIEVGPAGVVQTIG